MLRIVQVWMLVTKRDDPDVSSMNLIADKFVFTSLNSRVFIYHDRGRIDSII